jgi:hypothetical protein
MGQPNLHGMPGVICLILLGSSAALTVFAHSGEISLGNLALEARVLFTDGSLAGGAHLASEPVVQAIKDQPSSFSAGETKNYETVQPTLGSSNFSGIAGPADPASTSTSIASYSSASNSLNVMSGFGGLGFDMAVPPDVQVAVGPSHIVEMVNVEMEVWNKTGSPFEVVQLSSLFNSGFDFISDPKVVFDASSDRWFASILDCNSNPNVSWPTQCKVDLAVSVTSDPTVFPWKVNGIDTGTLLPDQPIIGVSDDKFVASANLYASASSLAGAQWWVFNKNDLVTGSGTGPVSFGPYSSLFSVHPVQSVTSTATEYMVTVGANQTGAACNSCIPLMFSITGTPPTVNVSNVTINIPTPSAPPLAPQAGASSSLIDTGDSQVQDAAWSGGDLWFALNDGCNPPGDTQPRSCFRLIEINTTSTSVVQSFDVASVGQYFFYPGLIIDGDGNLAIVFGYSSPTEYPGLMITGRSFSDSLNTWQKPQVLKAGLGPETSYCTAISRKQAVCRYGDYFGASPDPSTGLVSWVAGEYGTGAGWGTFIGKLSRPVGLTISYSVSGSGSAYSPPILTYIFNGTLTSATLNSPSTGYNVDYGTNWTISDPLPGSTASESWRTLQQTNGTATAPEAISLVYYHQFYVTFDYNIIGGGSGYSLPGVNYTQFGSQTTTTPRSMVWADAGTPYSYQDQLGGSDLNERWTTPIASGMILSSGEESILYYHQYSMTANYSVSGGGSPPSPVFSGTTFGTAITLELAAATSMWLDSGSNWNITNPLSASSVERWQAVSETAGMMNSPVTTSPAYYHQYLVNVGYSVVGSGTPMSPTLQSLSQGAPISIQLSTASSSIWLDDRAAYTLTNPLSPSTVERWQADADVSGNVAGPSSLEPMYYHEYYVTIQTNPDSIGQISATSNWYPAGQPLLVTTSTTSLWGFHDWVGTATGSYSGTHNSMSILVDGPITETANFYPGLVITVSEGGSITYSYDGESGIIASGTTRTLYVPPGTTATLGATSSSGLYMFSGWRGSITNSTSAVSLTVDSPLSINASFALNSSIIASIGILALSILLVGSYFALKRVRK